ncbi:hypothetical protein B0I35DRAFT_442660 [Stachybotrys elegans]|uniref:Uncharacterized protein n=1 Tax=Stachybotrys elegans TaxID=80388 RepID=A0A8K0WKR3_9HYPO|nr:hypothetical protein B0I35DRAFT_442660 [Stachybotrys elegans]
MAWLTAEVCFFAFNLLFSIPLAIFLYYTINGVFPLLAVLEDPDASPYYYLRLEKDRADDVSAGLRPRIQLKEPAANFAHKGAVTPRLRSMYRLLYSIRKPFSLLRGFGWLLLWNVCKFRLLLASIAMSPAAGLLFQIVAPLALVQLHTLWVHTTISYPSSKPAWRRVVPLKTALRSVAGPMLLALAAEAVTQRTMVGVYTGMEIEWVDFLLLQKQAGTKATWFFLLLTLLVVVLVTPAHLLLMRVQASLLPGNEDTIIALDSAIVLARDEGRIMTMMEALTSVKRQSLINLAFLYFKIIAVTWITVMVVGSIELGWYLDIAFSHWRF